MAQPITWQNVGVPQNVGANQLLGMAQEQYSNAFKGLGDIAQGLRRDNIAKDAANSEAQLNWFTEQARNLKPEQFTPETMNSLLANVTDPAARQAAVASFGKLGDEITGRAFQQEQRQAFTADEAQKALLRPFEVKKAEQGLRLGDAQIEAEKASTNASNAAAAANNLRTQALQMELADAKNARNEVKTIDALANHYTAEMIGGKSPTEVYNEVAQNPDLTVKQREALMKTLDTSVNTLNTYDPVLRAEIERDTATINNNYDSKIKSIDAQHKINLAKLPVDPNFTQVVGQEDVNKKIQDIASSADDAYTSIFGQNLLGYSDARHVMPSIKAGLDASAKDFEKQLKIELGAYIKDEKELDRVLAEEMRKGGMQKVHSLALDNLQYDPNGTKKIFEISSDGRELTDEINRMIKPYATTVANLYTREKMEDVANAERLKAASQRAKELNTLTSTYQRTGVKQYPDLKKSIDSSLKKTSPK